MSETIRPALDADAWQDRRVQFVSAAELIVHDDGDGLEFVVYPDAAAAGARRDLLSKHKIAAWATDDLAALIALANDALYEDGYDHPQTPIVGMVAGGAGPDSVVHLFGEYDDDPNGTPAVIIRR